MGKFYTKEEREEFYKSEKWEKIRQFLFSIRGKECETCKSKRNIQVHHLTYERFGGDELPEDLQILCSKHHREVHGIKNVKKSGRPQYLCIPTSLILNTNIPEGAKILFGIFKLYENNKNGCFATNSFLSTLIGLSERTISRNLSILEEWGYVKIENKSNTTKRKVFIDNYEDIYKEIADKIYNNRRYANRIKGKEYRNAFLEARDKYNGDSNDSDISP